MSKKPGALVEGEWEDPQEGGHWPVSRDLGQPLPIAWIELLKQEAAALPWGVGVGLGAVLLWGSLPFPRVGSALPWQGGSVLPWWQEGWAALGALWEAGFGPPVALAWTPSHGCCLGPWSKRLSGPALKGTKHSLDSFKYLSSFVDSGLGTGSGA